MRTVQESRTTGRAPASGPSGGRRPETRPEGSHASQTWATIAGFVFGALRLNAVLILGSLPLVLLCVLAADPLSALPALILALYLALPIITAAFCAFRDAPVFEVGEARPAGPETGRRSWWGGFSEHQLLRPVWGVLRATARRVLTVTALPMGAVLVLSVDVLWVLNQSWGLIAAPALGIAALLALMTAFGTCVMISERAEGPAHALVRAAAFAVMRGFPFTILSLVTLGIGLLGLIWQPILCWALASSLILYVVWANTRWSIAPALRHGSA